MYFHVHNNDIYTEIESKIFTQKGWFHGLRTRLKSDESDSEKIVWSKHAFS
jgi:hypothetical protein